MKRLTEAALAIVYATLALVVLGEFDDRDAKFDEIRQQELVTQTEKAVALISDGK